MSNTADGITVVKSADDVPGLFLEQGQSENEAAEGLFDALGSEGEEFYEDPEGEDQPEGEETEDDLEDLAELDDDDEESEEDDEESEEGETESEEDGDEADSATPELTDDTIIEGVPLPGGERTEVTLAELKAGYSRTQDYTQKRQRDAAEHAAAMTELSEVRSTYQSYLDGFRQMLEKSGPAQPSEALRAENPGEYAAQMADWNQYQQTIAQLGQAQDAVAEEISAEEIRARQDHLAMEWSKVLTAVPEWADRTVAQTDLRAIHETAIREFGFTAQEMEGLTDSRVLLMMKRLHDGTTTRAAAEETVAKKKKKATKRLGGGSTKAKKSKKGKRKQRDAADDRLRQTGSVRDAAAAIALDLEDDPYLQ